MSQNNHDEILSNSASQSHKNVPLTHKTDLEIEDILTKLQEVTRDTQLPASLTDPIQNPYENDQSKEIFMNTPSLR